jgi:ribosomal protein L3 glutamine methyltransferase
VADDHDAGALNELVTILDLVRHASSRFVEAGVTFGHGTDNPVDEAVFLVGEALRVPPDRVEAFMPARTTLAERRRVLGLIEARVLTRKPAAYLVHRAYMHGVPFYVDERVIVPRSYIGELLDGLFAEGSDGFLKDGGSVRRVLDLCTGSGCLAILAAMAFPDASVDAVDISGPALEVARKNVADLGLEDRVHLFDGDLFEPVKDKRYDLILANPPYVDAAGMKALPAEFRHEPSLALAAGKDGLDVAARIVMEAGAHLVAEGGLLCEIGRCRPALERRFPDTAFVWIDSAESSGEVFWLSVEALG